MAVVTSATLTLNEAWGAPPTPSSAFIEIQKIDNDIIKQQCEIFKANTALRTEFGRNPRGRRLRMAVAQSANYVDTFAGLLINMIYNLYWSAHGGAAPSTVQVASTTTRFVGKAFFLSDLTLETMLQALEHRRELKAGFDPKTTFKRVSEYNSNIDGLLKRRLELEHSAELRPEELHLAMLEQNVLQQGTSLADGEFSMLYSRARSISARNRVYNTLTAIKKADATFGADLTRIIGGATDNPHLSGPASINTTISGYMSLSAIWYEMLTNRLSYSRNFKKSEAAAGNASKPGTPEIGVFDASRDQYIAAVQKSGYDGDTPIAHTLGMHEQIYQSMGGMVDSLRYQREKELHHQRMHDIHSIIYHLAYGGSKLSRGAWLIYVGFHYVRPYSPMFIQPIPNKAVLNYDKMWVAAQKTQRRQRVSLINGYAGIDNFAGSAYRVADYLTYDLLQVIHRKRDSIDRRADEALVRSRWDMLDSMEEDAAQSAAELTASQQQEPSKL